MAQHAEPDLRGSLVRAHDLAAFQALMADRLRLVAVDRKGRAGKPTTIEGSHLDQATFSARLAPLVPHEPSPMDGEGEELACDEARGSCVFQDALGRATTYLFDGGKLKEIRFPAK